MAATRTSETSATRSKKSDSAPKPTMVLLVRNGRTPTTGSVLPGRAKGLHLADDGRAQAEAVAQRIKAPHDARTAAEGGVGITAIYASPMDRTQETAAPLAKALGLRTRTRAGLVECDFGARKRTRLNSRQ